MLLVGLHLCCPTLCSPVTVGVAYRFACSFLCVIAALLRLGEAEGEATDRAGWERYSVDWRNYFDCMLAPVARQAAGQRPITWSTCAQALLTYGPWCCFSKSFKLA